MAFPHGGKSKNGENQLSPARENKNSAKISFPPRGKDKKRQKQPVARGFSSKIAKSSISLASDGQKTQKTGFRSQAKCKKWEKQRFACKRRAKNGENGASGHPER